MAAALEKLGDPDMEVKVTNLARSWFYGDREGLVMVFGLSRNTLHMTGAVSFNLTAEKPTDTLLWTKID